MRINNFLFHNPWFDIFFKNLICLPFPFLFSLEVIKLFFQEKIPTGEVEEEITEEEKDIGENQTVEEGKVT